MPRPQIIGSLRSTYTRAVCMACEEKGIDYTLTEALLGAPELFAVHPFGKMPVLRHDDFTLFESKAIVTYLDHSFPGPELIPSDARLGGLTEQWVSLINTAVDTVLTRTYLLAYAAPRTPDGKPDRAAIDAMVPILRQHFDLLDRAVAATGHLVGDRLTFADIDLMPILYYVRQLPEGADAFARSPHLAAYYDRHAARPSFVRTIPPPGPPGRAR